MVAVLEGEKIVCPHCNKICVKLVALYDNGTGKACRDCKKKIKAGKINEIVKFKRDEEMYRKVEQELNLKSGKRMVVTPK